MASFRRIVIIVTVVVLVVSLVLVGVGLTSNAKKIDMEPASCPDWWVDMSTDGSKCVNKKRLGKCNLPNGADDVNSMDFSTATFTGSGGSCAKQTWANNCGVVWSGITELDCSKA